MLQQSFCSTSRAVLSFRTYEPIMLLWEPVLYLEAIFAQLGRKFATSYCRIHRNSPGRSHILVSLFCMIHFVIILWPTLESSKVVSAFQFVQQGLQKWLLCSSEALLIWVSTSRWDTKFHTPTQTKKHVKLYFPKYKDSIRTNHIIQKHRQASSVVLGGDLNRCVKRGQKRDILPV